MPHPNWIPIDQFDRANTNDREEHIFAREDSLGFWTTTGHYWPCLGEFVESQEFLVIEPTHFLDPRVWKDSV